MKPLYRAKKPSCETVFLRQSKDDEYTFPLTNIKDCFKIAVKKVRVKIITFTADSIQNSHIPAMLVNFLVHKSRLDNVCWRAKNSTHKARTYTKSKSFGTFDRNKNVK